MEVVEFPSDVMDASEDVESVLEEVHGVSVPDCWDISLIFQLGELEFGQAEAPQVVEPAAVVLPPENEHVLVVSGQRTARPGTRHIYIRSALPACPF